ncbi:S1 RNA-binding domain-containing protein [Chloroflexi bacterium TSY]|nr:S1 RNA-binding domain-containing protein [Chloroflexi bacterium TSY]
MSEQLETVIENGVQEISPPIEANPVETDPVKSASVEVETSATDDSLAEADVAPQTTTVETTPETEVVDTNSTTTATVEPVETATIDATEASKEVKEMVREETVVDSASVSVESRPNEAAVEVENSVQEADNGVTDNAPIPSAPTASASESAQPEKEIEASKSDESDSDSSAATAAPPSQNAKRVDNKKRVVRVLSVGQELQGTVKRIADFGAFIDIGVGRDGLLHVSELSVQRVGKVADVLSKGQEVTVWIKQLDRERNRISLTMVSPDTKTIRDLNEGDILPGKVTRIAPYGAFIDVGVGRDALLHIREMSNGYVKQPEDIVQVGEEIEVKIIALNRRRYRIDLSLKGLRPEPELEEEIEEVAEELEEEVEEEAEENEVLSAMELAFKRAMESGGSKNKRKQRKVKQRANREKGLQDDIFSRTLNTTSDS